VAAILDFKLVACITFKGIVSTIYFLQCFMKMKLGRVHEFKNIGSTPQILVGVSFERWYL